MSTKNIKKKVVPVTVRPQAKTRKDVVANKVTAWFTKYYKTLGLFLGGLILGIAIMYLTGYGNIAKIANGDELVMSVKGLKITANELYSDLKDTYGLEKVLADTDKYILTTKYSDKKDDATKYAEEYVSSLKSQYSDKWADFLSYYGFADDTALKASLVTQYYSNLVTSAYVKKSISDAEINKYYNDEIVGDIKVSHILIKADYDTDATDAEKEAALEKAKTTAEKLIKQLKASDEPLKLFATLAKKNSDDTSNASKGGDLGYFNKGEMEETFEDAAYGLTKVGEFTTTPVETSYGYHIIIKTAKTKDKALLKDVKDDILTDLTKEKTDADSSLAIKAMMDLRKQFKLTFEEPKMETAYNEYMTTKIAEAKEKDSSSDTTAS